MTKQDLLRKVSLCWLTLAGATHAQIVGAASDAGFGSVGLKLVRREGDQAEALVGNAPAIRQVKRLLAETGTHVLEMGGTWLDPSFNMAALLPCLELGAELKAEFVIAVGIDPDRHRLEENLATMTAAAADHGIKTIVEFTAYTAIKSLEDARILAGRLPGPQPAILLDALHYCRSGGTAQALAGSDNRDVALFHLCDGPATPPADLAAEGRTNRLYPGEGALPLRELMASLPSARLEVEAPCAKLAHLTARQKATAVAAATLKVLAPP